ncbi:hypothetical protein ACLKA6_000872 [Drosophila palustris]
MLLPLPVASTFGCHRLQLVLQLNFACVAEQHQQQLKPEGRRQPECRQDQEQQQQQHQHRHRHQEKQRWRLPDYDEACGKQIYRKTMSDV